MDGGTFTGRLVHWDEVAGSGHIQPLQSGLGLVQVWRPELRAGGITEPEIGMALLFSYGVSGNGVSAAVGISEAS